MMSRTPSLGAVCLAAVLFVSCGGDDESADTTVAPDGVDRATTLAPSTSPATTSSSTDAVATTAASTVPQATTAATAAPATTGAPGTTAGSSTGGKWEDPTGFYAIAFPAEPAEQNVQAPLPDGTSIPITAYLAEVEGAAAIVSCVDDPSGTIADPAESLVLSRDGSLERVGAELIDSEDVELQGRAGIAYRGAIGEAGGVLGRTFVDAATVCSMLVVGEPEIVEDVAPPFLDSFEFLKEAA